MLDNLDHRAPEEPHEQLERDEQTETDVTAFAELSLLALVWFHHQEDGHGQLSRFKNPQDGGFILDTGGHQRETLIAFLVRQGFLNEVGEETYKIVEAGREKLRERNWI